MADDGELRWQRWQIEEKAPQEGWDAVATEVILFDVEHTDPKPTEVEIETKIAEVGSFVSCVLSHIDEPTVFQSRTDNFLQFSTVIPDPEKPFSFSANNPGIYLQSRSKQIGLSSHHRMPGGRDITARISDDSKDLSIWMGAGARSENIHIPFFGKRVTENIAVGGKEITELFSELRGTSDAYNGRLFGALMHIAWLADDFGAKIPVVPSFTTEAEIAADRLDIEDKAAEGNIFVISSAILGLGNHIEKLRLESISTKSYEETARELAANVFLPRLANGPPGDATGLRGLSKASQALGNAREVFQNITKKEREEQRGRDRQRKLVMALMGISE